MLKIYDSDLVLDNTNTIRKDIQTKITSLFSSTDLIEKIPNFYNKYDFSTKGNVVGVKINNYIKLFTFFFMLGKLSKQLFVIDGNDIFYKVISLVNLALCKANPSYPKCSLKTRNMGIKSKRPLKLIPLNTRCVISLPGLSTRRVKALSSKRFFYHIPLVHKSTDLNALSYSRYVSQPSDDYTILMISNMYFFYKKGSESLLKKKMYRLAMLNLL